GDAHHVRRHEALAHALRRHEQPIRRDAQADVAVVAGRVAARVHPASDFDDVGAESFDAHAVLALYLSRHAVEQKYIVSRPALSESARSGTTYVPHTGSFTICTPCAGGCPSRARTESTVPTDMPILIPCRSFQIARITTSVKTTSRTNPSMVRLQVSVHPRRAPTSRSRGRAWRPVLPVRWDRSRSPAPTRWSRRRDPACRTRGRCRG